MVYAGSTQGPEAATQQQNLVSSLDSFRRGGQAIKSIVDESRPRARVFLPGRKMLPTMNGFITSSIRRPWTFWRRSHLFRQLSNHKLEFHITMLGFWQIWMGRGRIVAPQDDNWPAEGLRRPYGPCSNGCL
jgi:hypothetical protein